MNQGRTVFSQIMTYMPMYEFRKCVDRYNGNHRVRSFSCIDQFLSMAFAQLTYRESLRDIEACLGSIPKKLYHMGFRGNVTRSTLADANENRDWRIYADFAQVLIHTARTLYQDDQFGMELDQTVYALDSTTIDLCVSLFPWAQFRTTKAAIKLHTLLDLRGNIPADIRITTGKVHDVNILDQGQRIKSDEWAAGDLGIGVKQEAFEIGVVIPTDLSPAFQAPFRLGVSLYQA